VGSLYWGAIRRTGVCLKRARRKGGGPLKGGTRRPTLDQTRVWRASKVRLKINRIKLPGPTSRLTLNVGVQTGGSLVVVRKTRYMCRKPAVRNIYLKKDGVHKKTGLPDNTLSVTVKNGVVTRRALTTRTSPHRVKTEEWKGVKVDKWGRPPGAPPSSRGRLGSRRVRRTNW